jgi:hypothetical protein
LRGLSEFCGKEKKEFEELQEFQEREPESGSQKAPGRWHIRGRSPASLKEVISARMAAILGFRFPLKILITEFWLLIA